jgi:hypothetical protein
VLAIVLAACSADPSATPEPTSRLRDSVVIDQTGALLTGAGQSVTLSATGRNPGGASLPVSWRSSNDAEVRVNAEGTVTSVTGVGSALVIAEAGGASAAVAVIVAEPVAGAVVIADDQVVRGPEPLDGSDTFPANGDRYRVTLSAAEGIAVGTTLIASGSAPIAGRVVEVAPGDGNSTVVYELVPLPAVLARYSIHLDLPVGATGSSEAASAAAGHPQVAAAGPVGDELLVALAGASVKQEVDFEKGPLKCSASAGASLESSSFDIKATQSLNLKVETEKKEAAASVPHFTRVLLTGPLALDISGGLKVEAGFEGSAACSLVVPIPISMPGILQAFLALVVPIGLSAGAEGKVKAIDVEVGPKGHLGTTVSVGFECNDTACFAIKDQTPDQNNGLKFESKVNLLRDARVEAGIAVSVVTGLGVKVVKTFDLVEARAGPVQAFNLALDEAQARDAGYASNYDLRLRAGVTPGSDLKTAISRLLGGEVTLDLSASWTPEQPIATSPTGRLTSEKARVQVDKPVRLFVDLDPKTMSYILIGPNVAELRIARREKDGSLRKLTSIPVMASGQSRFDWVWTPAEEFVGMNELVAFVVTNGLPGVPLEVAPDSTAYVEVVDACLAEPSTPGPAAPSVAPGSSQRPAGPTAPPPDPCVADGTLVYTTTTHLDTGPDSDQPTRTTTTMVTTMQADFEASDFDPLMFEATSGSWSIQYGYDHWQDRRFNGGADGCILTERAEASVEGTWDDVSTISLSYDPVSLWGTLSFAITPSGAVVHHVECPGVLDPYSTTFDASNLFRVGLRSVQGRREEDRIVFDFNEHETQQDVYQTTTSLTGRFSISAGAPSP